MSYKDFDAPDSPDSPSAADRRAEAVRILHILVEHESDFSDKLSDTEREFLSSVMFSDWISKKQLFWLRDIKAKYLD